MMHKAFGIKHVKAKGVNSTHADIAVFQKYYQKKIVNLAKKARMAQL